MKSIKHAYFLKKQLLKQLILRFLTNFLPNRQYLPKKNSVGIYTLLCHRDVSMYLFCLKSFFYYLGYELPVCIIDDGSLTNKDRVKINRLFHAKIFSRDQMDKQVAKLLKKYPHYHSLRLNPKTSILKYKIDAALISPFMRTLILDPDMIFQHKPQELIDWIENNGQQILYTAHLESTFESDIYPEYAFRNMMFKHLKKTMTGSFSSGIMTFPTQNSLSLAKIESIAQLLQQTHADLFGNIDEIILSGVLAGDPRAHRLPHKNYLIMAFPRQYLMQNAAKAAVIHFGFETKSMFFKHAIKGIKPTNFYQPKAQTQI